jgi:hypothetical protein
MAVLRWLLFASLLVLGTVAAEDDAALQQLRQQQQQKFEQATALRCGVRN